MFPFLYEASENSPIASSNSSHWAQTGIIIPRFFRAFHQMPDGHSTGRLISRTLLASFYYYYFLMLVLGWGSLFEICGAWARGPLWVSGDFLSLFGVTAPYAHQVGPPSGSPKWHLQRNRVKQLWQFSVDSIRLWFHGVWS